MPKVHELLAVESNLENQANKTRSELVGTFDKKRHLFAEKRITFTPLEEGKSDEIREMSDIQTTVLKEMEWIGEKIAKAIDASHAIDIANTQAKSDVVLEDGTILLHGVPATSLLQLEKRIKEVQELITAIPTLDPAKGFTEDSARGKGFFKAREVRKPSTKKTNKVVVLYPATEKHPAQTQLVTEDVPVGTLLEQEWSAMITPAKKAELLDQVELLARAIKKARSRANEQEVDLTGTKIGKKLLDFVFAPLDVKV